VDDNVGMALRMDAVELRRVGLPLVTPFRTSHGVQTHRDALLIHVMGPDGGGWGECVAMSSPLYSAEYVDGAEHVVAHHLVPRLWDLDRLEGAAVGPALAPVKGHPMAKAALELAVLDAELRQAGVSLAHHLGAVRTSVEVGVSVGIMESVPELLDCVAEFVAQGYRRVKLKIEPGWDVVPVAATRERFGAALALQVDANSSYRLDDSLCLASLQALDVYGLVLIEQPLAEDDLRGHAELAARLVTPLCLDESITSLRSAAEAIDLGACRIVNIKAGRVGGYLQARRIHDLCLARGVAAWCGGMLETGIGRAANLALAALPGFTLPGDLSASDRYFRRDITAPFLLADGALAVPDAPGIGVDVIPELLEELTTSVQVLGRPS
jgi:o-succinylbenzoate synthase